MTRSLSCLLRLIPNCREQCLRAPGLVARPGEAFMVRMPAGDFINIPISKV
jgi:hypothetical protein